MAFKHRYRSKDGHTVKNLTGMTAIREKCMDCCCWDPIEIRLCPIKTCALYPFRFGRSPKKGEYEVTGDED